MRKKLLALMLAFACTFTVCASTGFWQEPTAVEAATKKKVKAPSINKVYQAVKNAYGDNYTPNTRIPNEELKQRYGISSKWYSSAIAEVPMISTNADTLIIVKAKNASSKKKIKTALKKYQEGLIQDTHQYPMNQLKIQASRVYVKGSYVCFLMLGSISNKQEEQSEDKVIAAYKKQNEKAVKAINKLYK